MRHLHRSRRQRKPLIVRNVLLCPKSALVNDKNVDGDDGGANHIVNMDDPPPNPAVENDGDDDGAHSRPGTVCFKVRPRQLFMVIRYPKSYTKSAQKSRKHFLERIFCFFTLSEILGGGCCQIDGIRQTRVYISITPV